MKSFVVSFVATLVLKKLTGRASLILHKCSY